MTRRSFSPVFKQEAAGLVLKSSLATREASDTIGVGKTAMHPSVK